MANVFTQVGEEFVVDTLDGTSAVPANYYIGWGTGAGTAAKGSTTLFTEAAEARVAATKSQPTTDTNRWVGTLTAGSNKTITNAGLFDASSGGRLIAHSDFAGVALTTGDAIQFTFDINWS